MYLVFRELSEIILTNKVLTSIYINLCMKSWFIKIFVGGDTIGGTPDPIPNSEVKTNVAEGSGNARIGNRRLFLKRSD